MGIVDFILNLAGLLLWLNWRSIRFDPLAKRTPATLMGTLRPAAPKKIQPWHFLVFIGALLALRALIYRWMAPTWIGKLDFITVVLSFHSNDFLKMLAFSFLSFAVTLGAFYLCLLLLSLLKGPDPIHRLVKIPLGRVDGWPTWTKWILPLIATGMVWFILSWPLAWMNVCTAPISVAHRIEQSFVVGLSSYLVWKFPLGALLALHLLSSYIYFGKHPFWKYVSTTAQTVLSPMQLLPLRMKKMDFAPVVGVAAIFLVAHFIEHGIKTKWFDIYGLVDLFQKLPI